MTLAHRGILKMQTVLSDTQSYIGSLSVCMRVFEYFNEIGIFMSSMRFNVFPLFRFIYMQDDEMLSAHLVKRLSQC